MGVDFHFLRPLWLLLVLAAVGLVWLWHRRSDVRSRWQGIIAPHLLDALLVEDKRGFRLQPIHLVAAALALAGIAAAGPTWEQELPPFTEDKAPMVVAIGVSRSMQAGWRNLVEAYFRRRPPNLAILLVDARHPLTEMDRDLLEWLQDRNLPFLVAATKCDKLSRNELQKSLKNHLSEIHRPELLIPCSAITRAGIPKLWAAIDGTLHETTPTH
jgi:hypothetical protein